MELFVARCQPLGDFHNSSRSVPYHEIVKALILPEAFVSIRRFEFAEATLCLSLLAKLP